jgi:V-type H+-transporting ATPase subunit a
MMGFFSTFIGFIYNDFTSIPIELFTSCIGKDCAYPFGVDYKWYNGKNLLSNMNSVKMKIAVIFGVA